MGQIISGTVYFHIIIRFNSNSAKMIPSETTTMQSRCIGPPNCVFMMIFSSVMLLRFLSANILFYCCLAIIPILMLQLSTEVATISKHSSSKNIRGQVQSTYQFHTYVYFFLRTIVQFYLYLPFVSFFLYLRRMCLLQLPTELETILRHIISNNSRGWVRLIYLMRFLRLVSPPYFCSVYSLITFCFVILYL